MPIVCFFTWHSFIVWLPCVWITFNFFYVKRVGRLWSEERKVNENKLERLPTVPCLTCYWKKSGSGVRLGRSIFQVMVLVKMNRLQGKLIRLQLDFIEMKLVEVFDANICAIVTLHQVVPPHVFIGFIVNVFIGSIKLFWSTQVTAKLISFKLNTERSRKSCCCFKCCLTWVACILFRTQYALQLLIDSLNHQ